jgi:membrane protein implicated in regulation of membrane protease activity
MAGSLFFLASGAVFLIYGLTSERELTFIFITILGICFLGYALFLLLWSRRLAAQTPKTESCNHRLQESL